MYFSTLLGSPRSDCRRLTPFVHLHFIFVAFSLSLYVESAAAAVQKNQLHTAVADACNGSDGAAAGGGALCELISRTRGSPSEMQLHL